MYSNGVMTFKVKVATDRFDQRFYIQPASRSKTRTFVNIHIQELHPNRAVLFEFTSIRTQTNLVLTSSSGRLD